MATIDSEYKSLLEKIGSLEGKREDLEIIKANIETPEELKECDETISLVKSRLFELYEQRTKYESKEKH